MTGLPVKEQYFFNCTLCGECCRGDMSVFLNPRDLYKMAVYLGFSESRRLFTDSWVELVSGQNGMPVPKIRFRKAIIEFCPFLINELDEDDRLTGKCSLHPDRKPLICSLSPLAREVDVSDGSSVYSLIEPTPECPGMNTPKANRLSENISRLQEELTCELRFYRILNRLREDGDGSVSDVEKLYYFTVDEPFENILTRIEKHYGVLP